MAKFNDLRRDRPRKNLGFDRNNVLTKKQGRRWKNFINHQFFAASMKFRFLEQFLLIFLSWLWARGYPLLPPLVTLVTTDAA